MTSDYRPKFVAITKRSINAILTGKIPPGLAAAGELGYSGCEGESKQQPADQQHSDAVMAVMPDSVVQTEEVERRDQDCDEPCLE